jgi:hypothetical protein
LLDAEVNKLEPSIVKLSDEDKKPYAELVKDGKDVSTAINDFLTKLKDPLFPSLTGKEEIIQSHLNGISSKVKSLILKCQNKVLPWSEATPALVINEKRYYYAVTDEWMIYIDNIYLPQARINSQINLVLENSNTGEIKKKEISESGTLISQSSLRNTVQRIVSLYSSEVEPGTYLARIEFTATDPYGKSITLKTNNVEITLMSWADYTYCSFVQTKPLGDRAEGRVTCTIYTPKAEYIEECAVVLNGNEKPGTKPIKGMEGTFTADCNAGPFTVEINKQYEATLKIIKDKFNQQGEVKPLAPVVHSAVCGNGKLDAGEVCDYVPANKWPIPTDKGSVDIYYGILLKGTLNIDTDYNLVYEGGYSPRFSQNIHAFCTNLASYDCNDEMYIVKAGENYVGVCEDCMFFRPVIKCFDADDYKEYDVGASYWIGTLLGLRIYPTGVFVGLEEAFLKEQTIGLGCSLGWPETVKVDQVTKNVWKRACNVEKGTYQYCDNTALRNMLVSQGIEPAMERIAR